MQRGGMRGFNRGVGGGGGKSSIRSRLGFGSGTQQQRRGGGGLRVAPSGRIVAGNSNVGGSIKSRLGPGVKGPRSVASVAIGELVDARQKINLKRVQTGRVADARQKIEEKRRKKAIISGKIRNFKITAAVSSPQSEQLRNPSRGGFTSRTGRENLGHEGLFRSGVDDVFSYTVHQSGGPPSRVGMSSYGGSGFGSPQMRIAPPSDDFMLTRTIRNPDAAYEMSRGPQQYSSRSSILPPPKLSSSIHFHSHDNHPSYNRSAFDHQPMAMDEDDYEPPLPVKRSGTYSSNNTSDCRIFVSNLQLSVTADDIVELFSDIGPLLGARMTGAGQAEVTYARKVDALKAIEAYHNRLLDGSAMRVFLDTSKSSVSAPSSSERNNSLTALKSASGASMKLPSVAKSSSGLKIQPDISAIHKVLFNPGSSGTRGLFKGGQ